MTATQLRADIYNVIDRVLETGEAVEIERNGKIVKLVSTELDQEARLDAWIEKLQSRAHPGFIVDPNDDLSGASEWDPDRKFAHLPVVKR